MQRSLWFRRLLWLTCGLLNVSLGVALAKTFTEKIPADVTIILRRTPSGIAYVRANVTTQASDGTFVRVLRNYDVIPALTVAQKIQTRDTYDMLVNAIAVAESIPTPVQTP